MGTINIPATHTGYMASFNNTFNGTPDCQTGDYSGSTSIRRATLKFAGLSNGMIPKGVLIDSATMYLYTSGSGYTYPRYRYLYRSLRNMGNYATWLSYGDGNWAGAGCSGAGDYEQIGVSPVRWDMSGFAWRTIPINKERITGIIKGLLPNYGFVIRTEGEYSDLHGINYGANLPYISVKYSFPGIQPAFISDYGIY